MTTEEVAEMFSIVKKINDEKWLSDKTQFQPKKPYVMKLAEKLKLQLSMQDFKMVTEKSVALRCKYPSFFNDKQASYLLRHQFIAV